MHYYQITNPGTANWISHEDNQIAQISQYGNDIWVTENTAWAERVGATELTKEQAQTICDTQVTEARVIWEACKIEHPVDDYKCGPEPQYYTLP